MGSDNADMAYDSARPYARALLVLTFSCAVLVLAPKPVAAQGFISPFIGFDYGGDSGCPTAGNCEDKHSNLGVAGGKLGAIAGAEVEFGYARDFFGDTPGVDSSVLTLMTNVIVGPRIGVIRPFVLGGVGLIKSHVELDAGSLLDSSNNFGWNLGGGVMLMFGDHVGVRGDIRRFRSFQDISILGFDLSEEKLTFNRASAGLVLAF
jgi:opacity protein-like surface antigen